MSSVPAGVRAIFFDAVGTVIHPVPAVGAVYAEIGQRFGSRLDPHEIRQRFTLAFARQEQVDARVGHGTTEAREYERWLAIVNEVLDDVADREGCFLALYDHFAQPRSWRCEPGVEKLFQTLDKAGYLLGIASNFDHRLRQVVEGFGELSLARYLIISSEVGWKKPAREFFDQLCRIANLSSLEILFIGDDLDNDYKGARSAGLHAYLFDPQGRSPLPILKRLPALTDLLLSDRTS